MESNMSVEFINEIKMEKFISSEQMQKLETVLSEVLYSFPVSEIEKDRNHLIEQFICAKKVEGFSDKTEQYYCSTLSFFQKKINKNLCYVNPENVREYLCDYQKIHNCTNVTLDNIRRI